MQRIDSNKIAEWANLRRVPDFNDGRTGIGDLFELVVVPILWYCKMDLLEGLFFVWEVGIECLDPIKGPTDESPAIALGLAIEKMIDNLADMTHE